ncbi:hypothetical protein N7465_011938 [Penicillium sp. CMV-2018d]|nr:hypothetical protein N7465_011938 [Penicillium sp. CMV-2018d]
MADALACVGAYASTAGSDSGVVDRMISEEREKLVRNFHSYTDTLEFCLAALHAVCIYQIMGLFGDSFLPAAVKKPMFSNGSEERRQEFDMYWRYIPESSGPGCFEKPQRHKPSM